MQEITEKLKPEDFNSTLYKLQCFDAVGWVTGRASGL